MVVAVWDINPWPENLIKNTAINRKNIVDIFESNKVFTWHRDTFDLPEKAVLIAKTNFPQIFKIQNSFGLQFHPEITKNLFLTWYSSDLSKKELAGFNVEEESSNLFENLDNFRKVMHNFYYSWVEY